MRRAPVAPSRRYRLRSAVPVTTALLLFGLLALGSTRLLTTAAASTAGASAVGLVDDDGGGALFSADRLSPGRVESACVGLTASGSVDPATEVTLDADVTDGGLAPYLQVWVEAGAVPDGGTCGAFTGTQLWSGTLDDFPAAGTAGIATGWHPAVTPRSVYRFTVTVLDDPRAETLGTAADFRWAFAEAAPEPPPTVVPPTTEPTPVPPSTTEPVPTTEPTTTSAPAVTPVPVVTTAPPLTTAPAPAPVLTTVPAPTTEPVLSTAIAPTRVATPPTVVPAPAPSTATVPTAVAATATVPAPTTGAPTSTGRGVPSDAPGAASDTSSAPAPAAEGPTVPPAGAALGDVPAADEGSGDPVLEAPPLESGPAEAVQAALAAVALAAAGVSRTVQAVASNGQYPVGLAAVVAAFIGLQGRLDRRDPKLALARVREELFEYRDFPESPPTETT